MANSIKYFEEECINRFKRLEDEFMKNSTKMAEYVMLWNGFSKGVFSLNFGISILSMD